MTLLLLTTIAYSDHMQLHLNLVLPSWIIVLLHLQRIIKDYSCMIKLLLNMQKIFKISPIITFIRSKIKLTYVLPQNRYRFDPKQSCFNWKCECYRKCMFKALNKYRKFHTLGNRNTYVCAKFKYINIIRNRKLEHYENNINLVNSISCSKNWCKLANQMKSHNRTVRGNLAGEDFFVHFRFGVTLSDAL